MLSFISNLYMDMRNLLLVAGFLLWSGALLSQDVYVSGKVVDSRSGDPVAHASILVTALNTGTITNDDGEYVLFIPGDQANPSVNISCLGYASVTVTVSALRAVNSIVKLDPVEYVLKEVVVLWPDPVEIIKGAFDKIKDNYSQKPLGLQVFYREHLLEDDHSMELSEGLLGVYMSPYNRKKSAVQMKLLKGRKSIDSTSSKSLKYIFLGGEPHSLVETDIAHDFGDFTYAEWIKSSVFELIDVKLFDDRPVYEIEFDQKDGVEEPLYKGKIIIDKESMAVVSIDYRISPKGIKYHKLLKGVQKTMAAMAKITLDLTDQHVLVNYRRIDSLWYLNDATANYDFHFTKREKNPADNIDVKITLGTEMLVSEMTTENVKPFTKSEELDFKGPFKNKIGSYDHDFWKGDNYIVPSKKIRSIAQKLKDIQ